MPKREWDIPDDAFAMSQSTIKSLDLSPCRVTTVPEGVKIPPSRAMFLGTIEHAIIERRLTGEWTPFQVTVISAVEDLIHELADEEGFPLETLLEGQPVRAVAEQASSLAREWETSPATLAVRELEPIAVELNAYRYVTDLSNGQPFYLVTGGVDYLALNPLSAHLIGVDWKTAGRGWNNGDGTGSIQSEILAFLLAPEYGVIEDWWYVVGDWSRMKWKIHETFITPASVWAAVHRAIEWAEYLIDPNRRHLCTPSDGKKRGWWAKPAFNHGFCPTCKYLGDEWDERW